ncbi:ACR063W-Ap [Eremothecium gossypii ATCC 10895]|uniref:Dolichol phosphate-mannose biosynthesis regulatory protein n=1 Tax=Eremothecium gossypii (strain ATCC 10895 / CBS 109.51 / FGSC 9923 / NRRL Y-1056) TaxID=284811 RepID=D8FGB1_EREGS|nr:ACR063W-Ap [Eremothecium gossypii ATCC 10895]ADJ41754.1 ACR063W-Ap [Eremothecium gossypii ATCC 10895]AEY95580.1 FACR063W-Ap [Eremothecium gossypii FDAG1]
MLKFALLLGIFSYYTAWLLLPIFDLDGKLWLFPLPSLYAVLLPIVLLLCGAFIVGSSLGALLLTSKRNVDYVHYK